MYLILFRGRGMQISYSAMVAVLLYKSHARRPKSRVINQVSTHHAAAEP